MSNQTQYSRHAAMMSSQQSILIELDQCKNCVNTLIDQGTIITTQVYHELLLKLQRLVDQNGGGQIRQIASNIYERLLDQTRKQEAKHEQLIMSVYPREFQPPIQTCYGYAFFHEHKTLLKQHVIKRSATLELQGGEDPRCEAVFYTVFSKDNYPGLIRPVSADILPMRVVLITDYVHNGSLETRLVENFHGTNRNIKQIFTSVCYSIDYLHNHMATSHLDLKPDNILLDKDSNAIVFDLGMAAQTQFSAPTYVPQNNLEDYDFQRCVYTSGKLDQLLACVRSHQNINLSVPEDLVPRFSVPFSFFFNKISYLMTHPDPHSNQVNFQLIEELINSVDNFLDYSAPQPQSEISRVSLRQFYRASVTYLQHHIQSQRAFYQQSDDLYGQHFQATLLSHQRLDETGIATEKSHQPLILFPFPCILNLPIVAEQLNQQRQRCSNDMVDSTSTHSSHHGRPTSSLHPASHQTTPHPYHASSSSSTSRYTPQSPDLDQMGLHSNSKRPTDFHADRPGLETQHLSTMSQSTTSTTYSRSVASAHMDELLPPLFTPQTSAEDSYDLYSTPYALFKRDLIWPSAPGPAHKNQQHPVTSFPSHPPVSNNLLLDELLVMLQDDEYQTKLHQHHTLQRAQKANANANPTPYLTPNNSHSFYDFIHNYRHQTESLRNGKDMDHSFQQDCVFNPDESKFHHDKNDAHDFYAPTTIHYLVLLHFMSTTFNHRDTFITIKHNAPQHIFSTLTLDIDHFGICGRSESIGTVTYQAPENANRQIHEYYSQTKADIYSLGLILLRLMYNILLYERPLFDCSNFNLLWTRWSQERELAIQQGRDSSLSHRGVISDILRRHYPLYSASLLELLEDLLCPEFTCRPTVKKVLQRIEQVDWTLPDLSGVAGLTGTPHSQQTKQQQQHQGTQTPLKRTTPHPSHSQSHSTMGMHDGPSPPQSGVNLPKALAQNAARQPQLIYSATSIATRQQRQQQINLLRQQHQQLQLQQQPQPQQQQQQQQQQPPLQQPASSSQPPPQPMDQFWRLPSWPCHANKPTPPTRSHY